MSANLRILRASALALTLVASGLATSAYAESSLGDQTVQEAVEQGRLQAQHRGTDQLFARAPHAAISRTDANSGSSQPQNAAPTTFEIHQVGIF